MFQLILKESLLRMPLSALICHRHVTPPKPFSLLRWRWVTAVTAVTLTWSPIPLGASAHG